MQKFEDERYILREYVYNYLCSHKCVHCNESDPRTLEFDHIDPRQKRFTISHAVRQRVTLGALVNEIKKCQILCANCHRKKTAKEQGWYKFNHGQITENPAKE